MNYKLAQLKRKLHVPDKPAPEPVAETDDSGLAAAISQLVQREVAKQRAAPKIPAAERLQNVERQLSEHAESIPWQKPFGAKPSSDWPAPSKQTPFPKAPITVSLMRDAAGKTIGATVGDKAFRIERDSAGKAIKMTEVT